MEPRTDWLAGLKETAAVYLASIGEPWATALVTCSVLLVWSLLLWWLFRRTLIARLPAIEPQVDAIAAAQDRLERRLGEELAGNREEMQRASREQRQELAGVFRELSNSITARIGENTVRQKDQLETMAAAIEKLAGATEQKLDAIRLTVEGRLTKLQEDNAKQLEQMRQTVDEKLQGTLEKRLGESFRQVSERLEQVHKGLGEMQSLATGVGDLKKVLSNVKTRGTWGEVQLGAMLEQVLTPEQYATNFAMKEGGERVEFAIRLPGRADDADEPVWLPIDAKFPLEDYQRLIEAQERGDLAAIELAGRQLETRVRSCARDIGSKYLRPPHTTDFGILFLPIEGLFAEVLRRPGLTENIQRESRVVIAGPTTLWAVLNSLQMGFRTLAIQERSSEVWRLLAAVKTEWSKYGEVLEAVQKKLHQASSTIEKAKTRSRAIGRKLKDVHELPLAEAAQLLPPNGDGTRSSGTEPLPGQIVAAVEFPKEAE